MTKPDYSTHTQLKRALVLAEPLVAEETHLAGLIATCREQFDAMPLDWDRRYERAQDLEEAENKLQALRAQIAAVLRPVHRSIWEMWAAVATLEDPKPEHVAQYEKIDRTARWIFDQLDRCLPGQREALHQETGEFSDEEWQAFFHAKPFDTAHIEELRKTSQYPKGRCPECGNREYILSNLVSQWVCWPCCEQKDAEELAAVRLIDQRKAEREEKPKPKTPRKKDANPFEGLWGPASD